MSTNSDRWPLTDGEGLHPSNWFDDILREATGYVISLDLPTDQQIMLLLMHDQLREAQRMGRRQDWELLHAIDVYTATVQFPPDHVDPVDWEDGWKAAMSAVSRLIHTEAEEPPNYDGEQGEHPADRKLR